MRKEDKVFVSEKYDSAISYANFVEVCKEYGKDMDELISEYEYHEYEIGEPVNITHEYSVGEIMEYLIKVGSEKNKINRSGQKYIDQAMKIAEEHGIAVRTHSDAHYPRFTEYMFCEHCVYAIVNLD